MIKRFPDGTAKPFLTPREYAELRDDDRFLYNEGADPSARITGDKGRENPAEGAPYGEGLIGRITALEAREAELVEAAKLAFPRGVCVTNRNIPDDTIVPVDFTMGELRRIDAAIARATLAKHQEGEGK